MASTLIAAFAAAKICFSDFKERVVTWLPTVEQKSKKPIGVCEKGPDD